MNWYRGPEGDQRIWYEEGEIERIVEDELRRAKLMPTNAVPVTNLEAFVEGHQKATIDQYADLDAGVLGLTQFAPRTPPAVAINADLTGSALDDDHAAPGLVGRWRATLAHEASHILLHRMLFEPGFDQGQLFAPKSATGRTNDSLMRCLKRDVAYRSPTSDWREVQANRGMAALLMPRRLFTRLARTHINTLGLKDLAPQSPSADRLARELAAQLDVSVQAASIRLETVGIVRRAAGTPLPTLR